MSSCKKCKKVPCGCDDDSLLTKPPCDEDSLDCLTDDCPETFSAGCTIWTEDDLVCDGTTLGTAGDSVADIITNILEFFCSTRASISLLEPSADPGELSGVDDLVISIDRNNCFDDDVVFAFSNDAPSGILFTWDDGTPQTASTMTRSGGRSTFLFGLDVTGVAGGNYSFNILVTCCGITLQVPITITV